MPLFLVMPVVFSAIVYWMVGQYFILVIDDLFNILNCSY